MIGIDLVELLRRKKLFSERAFGPGLRTRGICNHIRKELEEIEQNPYDLEEWIDATLLALDGAWRAGYSAEEVALCLVTKMMKNERRAWPDWRELNQDDPVEHLLQLKKEKSDGDKD